MIYRLMQHLDVDAQNDAQAAEWAKKIADLLKNPMAKMALQSEGIRIVGEPQAYNPLRPGEF